MILFKVINIASLVVTAATVITAITPNKTDDKYVNHVRKVLDIMAGNVGYNKKGR